MTPIKYYIPIHCCYPKCGRNDLLHVLSQNWHVRISMPEGWSRHEPSGYCLCPEHAKLEVLYYDDDSVFVGPATHDE